MQRQLLGLVVIASCVMLPLMPGVPAFWLALGNYIGMATLVALGLVVLTGVGGMTSFGQAAFVGFGAYTTAILSTRLGVSPWIGLLAGIALTALFAGLIGLVTLRLSGHFLPLGTICWGIAIYYLFGNLQFTGAYDGISSIPPISVLGATLDTAGRSYILIWLFVAIAFVLTRNLLNSRVGRAIRALRTGATAAEAFGVNTFRSRMTVFIWSAILASVSGWLFAHVQRAVSPSSFGLSAGIEYLLMAVVGGVSSLWGAVVGAAVVTLLKDRLQDILPLLFKGTGNYETIVFGVLLVALLQFARNGVMGLWEHIVVAQRTVPASTLQTHASPLPRRSRAVAGSPLLSVENIRKQFGGLVAVNDVTFGVKAGEIVGLIGPNGAGKSTTFNLVTGVLQLSSGKVSFVGEQIGGKPLRDIASRGIGRTFQHVKLIGDMSVLDNVALGAHLRGSAGVLAAMLCWDKPEEERLFLEARTHLKRMGLEDVMHLPASSLSLGQSRIVEIARALCLDPHLLLLDEPAAGLRHKEKQQLAAILSDLRKEGMSTLLVEHDMDFVMKLTDHIVVLDFGTRIAEGKPDIIRSNRAVLDAYLGGIE